MVDVVKVVEDGLTMITGRIKGTGTEPKYVHWGTGTEAQLPCAITNVNLHAAGDESRVAGTSSVVDSGDGTAGTKDIYQVIGELTCSATAPKAITEMGLFDDETGTTGNLFLRATFDPINLNQGDKIEFTVRTKFADGS